MAIRRVDTQRCDQREGKSGDRIPTGAGPISDRPLVERAGALVDWCRGFLGGFGLAGTTAHAKLSDEAQEMLRDLGNIAGSSFDFGNEDEDEDALIEVQEFVRVGAMLLHTECSVGDTSASGTLH